MPEFLKEERGVGRLLGFRRDAGARKPVRVPNRSERGLLSLEKRDLGLREKGQRDQTPGSWQVRKGLGTWIVGPMEGR